MRTSPEGVAEIAGHEGIVLSPYRDSTGTWTFGIGHTRAAGPPDPALLERGVRRPLGVALEIFREDLRRFEERVARAVAPTSAVGSGSREHPTSVPLTQHEFDALVSFDFNTGGIFRARLVKHLNEGDRAAAAAGFDGWHRPPEIVPRRNAEKRLFQGGVYTHGGKATIYAADADGRVDWGSAERVDVLALLRSAGAGPGARPRAKADRIGIAGGAGAAGVTLMALLGEVALWVAAAAIAAALGLLAWRNRAALGRAVRRIAGRAGR